MINSGISEAVFSIAQVFQAQAKFKPIQSMKIKIVFYLILTWLSSCVPVRQQFSVIESEEVYKLYNDLHIVNSTDSAKYSIRNERIPTLTIYYNAFKIDKNDLLDILSELHDEKYIDGKDLSSMLEQYSENKTFVWQEEKMARTKVVKRTRLSFKNKRANTKSISIPIINEKNDLALIFSQGFTGRKKWDVPAPPDVLFLVKNRGGWKAKAYLVKLEATGEWIIEKM